MPTRGAVARPKLNDSDDFATFGREKPAPHAEYLERRGDDVDWRDHEAAGVAVEAAILTGAALARSRLRDLTLRDVRLDRCDLAGADWTGASLVRCEVQGARLVGLVAAESRWRDVEVVKSPGLMAVFQGARLEACSFEDCDLTEISFEGATLKNVVFRNCELVGARFAGASLESVDVRGSRIQASYFDPGAVAGLIIDPTQAPIVATLAGATIEEVPPE